MLNYTCKKCCNIMKNFDVCPICRKDDDVVPIEINIHKGAGSSNKQDK